jgi:hypothetical protein
MPKTKKRRLTDEERAERRRADREFSRQAVERLRSSEGWQTWLAVRRHFRRYSMVNQALIAGQCPDATRVAGFRAWLALGYAVQRGEQAIRIWVPILPSRKALEKWERDGADPAERPRTYFTLGPAFDRSQVAPLPPPATPAQLDQPIHEVTGDELTPIFPRLIELAREIGFVVEVEPIDAPYNGYCDRLRRHIGIRQDMAVNAQVKTLTHELAHALLRVEPSEEVPKLDLASEELVVESVAFTVCGALGFDTASYSIPYLALWAESADMDTIERTAGLIDRLARRIEDAALTGERAAEL